MQECANKLINKDVDAILIEDSYYSIKVDEKNDKCLFTFGSTDIEIKKFDKRDKCKCNQKIRWIDKNIFQLYAAYQRLTLDFKYNGLKVKEMEKDTPCKQ